MCMTKYTLQMGMVNPQNIELLSGNFNAYDQVSTSNGDGLKFD